MRCFSFVDREAGLARGSEGCPLSSPAYLLLLIKCQFDEQSPYQASIIQKLKEAEERKKSIEMERLVNYLTPAKVDNVVFRIKNLSCQLAKIDIAQQKKEESEKAKV